MYINVIICYNTCKLRGDSMSLNTDYQCKNLEKITLFYLAATDQNIIKELDGIHINSTLDQRDYLMLLAFLYGNDRYPSIYSVDFDVDESIKDNFIQKLIKKVDATIRKIYGPVSKEDILALGKMILKYANNEYNRNCMDVIPPEETVKEYELYLKI